MPVQAILKLACAFRLYREKKPLLPPGCVFNGQIISIDLNEELTDPVRRLKMIL